MMIGANENDKEYKNLKQNENLDFYETRWELASIWGFSGQLQYSELFYGYYTNDTYSSYSKYTGTSSLSTKGYRIPLAYLTCTGYASSSSLIL